MECPHGLTWPNQSTTDAFDGMVDEVIALLDQADVIALGESHGSKLDSDFRLALVRHPEFGHRIDVIVVEFANAHRPKAASRMKPARWIRPIRRPPKRRS